jgi:bacillithiol system protein YtxJ
MNWQDLTEEKQIDELIAESKEKPVVIFKHSTRCGTSAMAKARLERAAAPEDISFYYLDLIKYRAISNKLAEIFHVHHESPQVLLLKNGECVYDESHNGIYMEDLQEQAKVA